MNSFLISFQLRNIESGYCLDTTGMHGSHIPIEVQPCQQEDNENQVMLICSDHLSLVENPMNLQKKLCNSYRTGQSTI